MADWRYAPSAPRIGIVDALALTMRSRFVCTHAPLLTFAIVLFVPFASRAQVLMPSSGPGGMVRTFSTDAAVLETQDIRKDLPFSVTPSKSALGFDLRFHAGYEVTIPLKDLAGAEDMLTMIFRVAPQNQRDSPVYFSQRVSVPRIEPDATGDAYLQG